ncbi:Vps60p KNAG_0K02150 [Huiozyma naganishii CBS 8797]|uniref:Uncharacterized protein n=1 Tax=Huiozyma naganishii (strain ATCC MYA-139 / BCRC 22969 / CBS 8797 / KCTC 17520 / NBRC 10181 / NCYC 3082 / Yp74L-3) TaxID=1071383 RepID=J7RRT7_HUIN7|nr:hypothetical protein KNAG_0K02150 [Kazachstania naganishii CBS 8797]CCK72578.1 hypothetical protein KNAG_0K02150 [Kazachstania naganishii CBS 8797]
MQRILGYGKKKNHEQLLRESAAAMSQAQESLQARVSRLDTEVSQLNMQLQGIQRRLQSSGASVGGQRALRQQAMKLLAKRRRLEQMRDSLDAQEWNMQQAQMTSETLQNTAVTVTAMQRSNAALKQQYGKIDLDKLEDLQDEMQELVARGDELQSALAMGNPAEIDDLDEDELDAELAALEQDADAFDEPETAGTVPSFLSGAVPQFIDDPAEQSTPAVTNPLETEQ